MFKTMQKSITQVHKTLQQCTNLYQTLYNYLHCTKLFKTVRTQLYNLPTVYNTVQNFAQLYTTLEHFTHLYTTLQILQTTQL